MKGSVIALTVAMNLAAADAIVKQIAVVKLKGSAAVCVIPNLFNLAYVENRGCAWGMFQGQVWPLAAFGILALLLLVWKRRAVFGTGVCGLVAAPLLYGGIVGNLADRIFRGYVVDLFDFHWGASHFPCFNLADTYICVAAGLMILASFLPKKSPVDAVSSPRPPVDVVSSPRPPVDAVSSPRPPVDAVSSPRQNKDGSSSSDAERLRVYNDANGFRVYDDATSRRVPDKANSDD